MRFALYGDEAVVDHSYAKVKEAFEQIPGAEVWGTKHVAARRSRRSSTRPSRSRAACRTSTGTHDRWYGGEEGGHIGFSPVVPLTGRERSRCGTCCAGDRGAGRARLHRGASCRSTRAASSHITMIIFDTKDEQQHARRLRDRQAARRGGGQARLRRVPRASRLHGPGGRAVLLQRPRLPALLRDDQGRGRPERASSRPASRGSGRSRCATASAPTAR